MVARAMRDENARRELLGAAVAQNLALPADAADSATER
jgi:hypothetical protein